MKKLFIVLAIASLGFVACNNESKTEEVKTDTVTATETAPVVTPDTTTVKADTTAKPDSTQK